MTVRDNILPLLNNARTKLVALGGVCYRTNAVTIRRRVWSGSRVGEGSVTNTDLVITPRPRVEDVSGREIAGSGGTYQDGDIKIHKITPAYSGGGYTPAQLYPAVTTDNEEIVVVLVGSAGTTICTIVDVKFDAALGYQLVVRPRRETP